MKVAKTAGGASGKVTDETEVDAGGGAADDDEDDATPPPARRSKSAADDDVVPRAQFERTITDMHKYKKAAKEAADKLAEKDRAELVSQNKWKELYEAEKARADEADGTSTKMKESFLNEKKYSALKTAAMAAGLKTEALDDLDSLDLDDIQVETTSTGRTNVMGVEAKLKKIQTAKPHWFGGKTAPKIDGKAPRVVDDGSAGGTEVTIAQVRAAEKLSKKTGDRAPYTEVMNRYRAQSGRRLN